MKKNTVFFGLSNVHVAFMKDTSVPGKPVYDTPKPIYAAVNFSPSPDSNEEKFWADNRAYYVSTQNNGYNGDLEMAKFPDEIVKEMLGWIVDSNGALVEAPEGETKKFALMFQIEGDARGRRVVYYCCTGSTPIKTTSGSNAPNAEKMGITIVPYDIGVDMGNGITTATKVVLEYDSDHADAYNNFFKAVYMPTITAAASTSTTTTTTTA